MLVDELLGPLSLSQSRWVMSSTLPLRKLGALANADCCRSSATERRSIPSWLAAPGAPPRAPAIPLSFDI